MSVTRRGFLKIAAGGGAAAAATAVSLKHPQRLISYVESVDHNRPGNVIPTASSRPNIALVQAP